MNLKLEVDGWKRITPPFWGAKSNSQKGKNLIYLIHSLQIKDFGGVVYIGKQTKSDRIKNFIQCHLAFKKFLEIKDNKKSKLYDIDVDGEPYGSKFALRSGIGRDTSPILKLLEYCEGNHISFKDLTFEVWVKDREKGKKGDEETVEIKKYNPISNLQKKRKQDV